MCWSHASRWANRFSLSHPSQAGKTVQSLSAGAGELLQALASAEDGCVDDAAALLGGGDSALLGTDAQGTDGKTHGWWRGFAIRTTTAPSHQHAGHPESLAIATVVLGAAILWWSAVP